MKSTKILLLSLLCILFLSPLGNAYSKDKVTIQAEIPFDRPQSVPGNIRAECELDKKMHDFLMAEFERNDVEVVTVEDISKAKGKVLDMKIDNLTGFGGGGWSGPKYMEMSGKLIQNGKKIGSFTARERSMGGGLRGFAFGGTCNIFHVIEEALAQDIVNWVLDEPEMGARLGGS
ncbi:MAG: hypothetical protein ABFS39_07465 [Pseudomonadota bacterium]